MQPDGSHILSIRKANGQNFLGLRCRPKVLNNNFALEKVSAQK